MSQPVRPARHAPTRGLSMARSMGAHPFSVCALRQGCSRAVLVGSRPAPASCSQVAGGGDWWDGAVEQPSVFRRGVPPSSCPSCECGALPPTVVAAVAVTVPRLEPRVLERPGGLLAAAERAERVGAGDGHRAIRFRDQTGGPVSAHTVVPGTKVTVGTWMNWQTPAACCMIPPSSASG